MKQLPQEFCRFRSFDAPGRDGQDKQAVYDLLLGRLKFSRLEDFNDPFEGRPWVVPAFEDPAIQRKAILDYLTPLFQHEKKISITQARREAAAAIAGKSLQQLVEGLGQVGNKIYTDENLQVFCLSELEALHAPLIWSHYADHHRGVAVHFDVNEPPFCYAQKVTYTNVYPATKFPRTAETSDETLTMGILTKCDLWHYEHEYRCIRMSWDDPESPPSVSQLGVAWEGTLALASAKAVKAITFGARMDDKKQQELASWIKENAPHVDVRKAMLHRREYKIVAELYS